MQLKESDFDALMLRPSMQAFFMKLFVGRHDRLGMVAHYPPCMTFIGRPVRS